MSNPRLQVNPYAKLVACALVFVCIVLGVVGLVLPIIPGLLFLAIAALIAARYFPSIGSRLRRNRTLGRHMDTADGFLDLPLWRKVQLSCLLCVKFVLDGIASIGRTRPRRDGWGSRS